MKIIGKIIIVSSYGGVLMGNKYQPVLDFGIAGWRRVEASSFYDTKTGARKVAKYLATKLNCEIEWKD